MAAGNVVVGHRLGLYRALAEGPATPEELAERADCHPRYLTEWLRGQAAGGYVSYDAETGRYSMTEEQAFALADPNGPLYAPGAFLLALGALRAEPRITGRSVPVPVFGWHEHDHGRVHSAASSSSGPVTWRTWPRAGSRRWTGSRRSWSPAGGWPTSDAGSGRPRCCSRRPTRGPDRRVGLPRRSIELARKRAADAGVADRVSFEVASAQTFSGGDTTW